MSYFSRLTDIVTCNLSELLADAENPQAALEEIIDEMRAGVEAAQRSVTTARITEERIRTEIDELSNQRNYWHDLARQELKEGRDDKARLALMRKGEVEDLIAGIRQQHVSSESTLRHLTTTLHALEAIRRRASATAADTARASDAEAAPLADDADTPLDEEREQQIEAELAALKRELDG